MNLSILLTSHRLFKNMFKSQSLDSIFSNGKKKYARFTLTEIPEADTPRDLPKEIWKDLPDKTILLLCHCDQWHEWCLQRTKVRLKLNKAEQSLRIVSIFFDPSGQI